MGAVPEAGGWPDAPGVLGGLGDDGGCGAACVIFGVIFKKDLNPTYAT